MSCIVFEASKTTSFNAEDIQSISPPPNIRKKNYQSQHFQIKSGSLIDPTEKRSRSLSTNIPEHATRKHSNNKLMSINLLEIPRSRSSDKTEAFSKRKTKQKAHESHIYHQQNLLHQYPILRDLSTDVKRGEQKNQQQKQHQQQIVNLTGTKKLLKQSRGRVKKEDEISPKVENKEDEILRLQQKMARLQNKVASMQRKVILLQKNM